MKYKAIIYRAHICEKGLQADRGELIYVRKDLICLSLQHLLQHHTSGPRVEMNYVTSGAVNVL